jgi:5-methylcytosine-specific restriction endonuclease McrA
MAAVIHPETYEPLSLEEWMERAPEDSRMIKTSGRPVPAPDVVVLKKYGARPPVKVGFNRQNLFKRDIFTCFAAGTRILMADGRLKSIEDIEEGDRVIDAWGSPQSVVATGNRKTDNVVRLKSRRSWEETLVTSDHRFLTPQKEFVEVEKRPNYLVLPRNISYEPINKVFDIAEFISKEMPSKWFRLRNGRVYWSRRPHERGLPTTISPNPDLAYWLGLYCAEGYNSGKGHFTLAFHLDEEDTLARAAAQIGEEQFGLSATVDLLPERNSCRVRFCSKMLGIILDEHVGHLAQSKKVPWDLIGPYHREFLRGLVEGDGRVYREEKKVVLTMAGSRAIFGAQSIMWGLGIFPTVQNINRQNRLPAWGLNLHAENYFKFLRKVMGEEPSERGTRIFGDDEFIWRKLQDIEPVSGSVRVFDIEVENTHSFIANGYAVHNCQYCGTGLPGSKLQVEHVLPRSKGGATTWENCVAACDDCNSRKADRTPREAGMKLRKKPTVPRWKPGLQIPQGAVRAAWEPFLTKVG